MKTGAEGKGLEQVTEAVRKHRQFVVSTHINPEGDALGSALALALLLRQQGKEAQVITRDPVPPSLDFLPYQGIQTTVPELTGSYEVFVTVDCGDLERTALGKNGKVPASLVINIDHHLTNRGFGQINWIDPDAAATGEMIYRLARRWKADLTPEIALCLYTALVTETGSFRYSNTSAELFRIAAELADRGVEPWVVAHRVYERNSRGRLALLGEILRGLEVAPDGRVAWVVLTQEMFRRTGTGPDDTEELVNYPRSVDGVEVAVLFRENPDGNYKISLRSKDRADVAQVAGQFGGGGHRKAAGCTIEGPLDRAKARVLRAVAEALPPPAAPPSPTRPPSKKEATR